MKTQELKKIALILFVPLVMVSCLDKNSDPDLEVFSDAYVVKKLIKIETEDGEKDSTHYAITFYAFGNKSMNSGKVIEKGSTGDSISLSINAISGYTLEKLPEDDDFSLTVPVTTEYFFNVKATSGEVNQSTDKLTAINLAIPVISKTELGSNKTQMKVGWTKVTNADGYVVKVVDKNGKTIYNSVGIVPETVEFTINTQSGSWSDPITSGEEYTIQVHAFAYEANADPYYVNYNIEGISIGEKLVTWDL